jgi:putative transposase
MFGHKNVRLTQSDYVGYHSYFVTICCLDRRPVFADPCRCSWLLEKCRAESAARAFAIHAYCVMPDHFHFLTEGLKPSSDLLNLVKSLKLKTSRSYRAETSQILWQKKFFDHILRSNESIESVARYIWMNPVRKGLSKAIGEYPFAGSLTGLSAFVTPPSALWIPAWATKAPASEGGRYTRSCQIAGGR